MSDLDIFRTEYVPNVEAVPYHVKWMRANPLEAQRWATFRDALIAGQQPTPPSMTTRYGKALVAAGKMALAESVPVPELTPPPPLPEELADLDIVVTVSGAMHPINGAFQADTVHVQYPSG